MQGLIPCYEILENTISPRVTGSSAVVAWWGEWGDNRSRRVCSLLVVRMASCQNVSFLLTTTAITASSTSITAAAISVSFKLRAFPWKLHFRISQVFPILASQNVVPVVWDHRSIRREPVKNTGSQAPPQTYTIATCISARSMVDSYMNFCLRSAQLTEYFGQWDLSYIPHLFRDFNLESSKINLLF